ncbi:SDR family NAD(P)-dependent oxidoreductase [Polyangium sp. y55x31]|uniref:SDR family NAD(P)-dependent oxidoreductase n=1 Tax=Polyangium sp. y55x31 TaxID=3042688 RepID=UPI002482A767|nr:SDR family NAD(P)-dependent oxidoreductase [Polyangium sp. y55x31]MDI1475684.1 SDR family NAD(P)-dependent oxidoreductase [Polyangium sp. y55x31]
MPIREFRGKVAVVTGAASGIGLSITRALVRHGAHVALVDKDPAVEKLAAELTASGSRATAHVRDVADRSRMLALPDEILAAHGHVNLLVNNAGVSVAGPFEATPLEDVDWIVSVNFWGVVHGCRAFLPALRREPEAHIVNVTSSFAWLGLPGKSAYSATKAAVRAFSESLRIELASASPPENPVGVTLLFPGPVDTNIIQAGRVTSETQRSAEAQFLASRGLDPNQVAERCLEGIQANAARVVLGTDYRILDLATRLSPDLSLALATRLSRFLPF